MFSCILRKRISNKHNIYLKILNAILKWKFQNKRKKNEKYNLIIFIGKFAVVATFQKEKETLKLVSLVIYSKRIYYIFYFIQFSAIAMSIKDFEKRNENNFQNRASKPYKNYHKNAHGKKIEIYWWIKKTL